MPQTHADARGYDMDPRDLHTRQVLFARMLGKLLAYAESKGYELLPIEVGILEQRKGRQGDPFTDGVHMPSSLHYKRLAADFVLWDAGDMITDGAARQWKDLGSFWEGLDPLCAWGGNFRSVDSNHFSVRYGGRA